MLENRPQITINDIVKILLEIRSKCVSEYSKKMEKKIANKNFQALLATVREFNRAKKTTIDFSKIKNKHSTNRASNNIIKNINFLQNYSKKGVMRLALPISVKFLHNYFKSSREGVSAELIQAIVNKTETEKVKFQLTMFSISFLVDIRSGIRSRE